MTIHSAYISLDRMPAIDLDAIDRDLAQDSLALDGLDADFDATPGIDEPWALVGLRASWLERSE